MALGSTQPLTESSTSNFSWGGKGGQCIGLTTSTPSCTNCLEICEPHSPGNIRACPGLLRDCFTFAFMTNIDENHDKSALESFFSDRDLNFAHLNTSLEH